MCYIKWQYKHAFHEKISFQCVDYICVLILSFAIESEFAQND